jgi:CRP-like cAMP-binding protein
MLSGRHPFERPGADADETLDRILRADYSFETHEWRSVSGRARQLVKQLMEPDPERRMSSTQLLSHSWVRGEGVSEKPLPDTQERLRAFKTASQAIHGSLLLAALLHQEAIRLASAGEPRRPEDAPAARPLALRRADSVSRLRRTVTLSEGVGMIQPESRYDVVRAAYELFDPTNKGHIGPDDLRRVCSQLGLDITERDIDNMLAVLSPAGEKPGHSREISFDRFATMMHSSYRRRFGKGQTVFKQGDPVTGFYIIMSGELVVTATASSESEPREVTRLGPGDFFGETGLLEGRPKRNTTVRCSTDAELLMIDKTMFLQLTEAPEGSFASALADKIRERVEARQRARLKRAIELLNSASMSKMRFGPGEYVYRQGEPASFFYLVTSGTLEASFLSSTGERARLRTFGPGDQFGYDALVGESHDVSVVCTTPVEVLAVPREQLQKAFTEDSYLNSVWRAPADSASRLRRLMSSNAVRPSQIGPGPAGVMPAGAPPAPRGDQLPQDQFNMLLRRSRPARLAPQQPAFEQGDVPSAVFLLREGRCQVEVKSKDGEARVVAERRPGDHFGEAAVLDRRPVRNSGVRCVDEAGCSVGILPRAVFEDLLRAHPYVAPNLQHIAERRTRSRVRTVIQMAAERSDATTISLEPNQVLFNAGDKADHFFLIDSGSVQISYLDPTTGRLLPARRLHTGDVFGASGLLGHAPDVEHPDGSATRHNTAMALEPTVLRAVPHGRFGAVMRHDSQVAAAFRRTDSVEPTRLAAGGGGRAQ